MKTIRFDTEVGGAAQAVQDGPSGTPLVLNPRKTMIVITNGGAV